MNHDAKPISRWRQVGSALSPPLVAMLQYLVTPNALTVVGVLSALAAAVALIDGSFLIAFSLLLIGGLCDWLDGELARATDSVSRFGAFLDSVLDRLSDCAPLGALIVFYAGHGQVGAALLALAALLVSVLIPYAKSRMETLGVSAGRDLLTRAPRMALVIVGVALGPRLMVWALMLVTILGAFTVYQRLRRAYIFLAGHRAGTREGG